MSLPWFPFYIDKFLSDTLELDGEAGGAYLFLMLHYYAKQEPPRDNDRTLATIARLPMDRWLDRRPEIEAFFQIKDGRWHHTTIEKEIADGHAKLASSRLKAEAGGKAYAEKMAARRLQAEQQAGSKPIPSQEQATSRLEADPEAGPEKAHLTLTLSNSLSTDRDAIPAKEPEDIGTQIDPLFSLGENQVAVCKFDGATLEIIEAERIGFIAYHLERGSVSNDWDASWTRWWKNWKQHKAQIEAKAAAAKPKALPRVVVNTEVDWDAHAKRFAGGIGWPRGVGPDPTSAACRCPPEILTKHGIDPATGLKLKEPTT